MTRLWLDSGEHVITPQTDRRGHLLAFAWQGRTHTVQQVRQRWQAHSDWWSADGEVSRDYFAVTTSDGLLCVLYCDLLDQQWHIAKIYD